MLLLNSDNRSSFLGSVLFLASFATSAFGFRILGIFPYRGKSHWLVIEPILEQLARRGNNLTVLSHFPRKFPMDNYHDISIARSDEPGVNTRNVEQTASQFNIQTVIGFLNEGVEITCRKGLQHPEVQKLLNSKEKFDLIITEIFMTDCFLGFVHKFGVPHVGLRTAPLSSWAYDRISNPANPSYVPNSMMGKPSRMGFFDRVENTLASLIYSLIYRWKDNICTDIARGHFGQDLPPLREIASGVSVILANTHFAHQYARPMVPGLREIAGVHLPERKALPQDLEDWISAGKNGVIYFSLGSMLRAESMSSSKRGAFFEAFAELEERVLIRWDGNQSDILPRNVRTVKWSPQYDVISHPNVKLFIYHGGFLGITEGVYAGKPMVVIPFFGDQPTNAALLQEKGLAVVLRYTEVTKETLLTAVKTVLNDPSYRKTAELTSAVIRDRLVSPLDESVYWIEYVARHRGAPWLRSSADGMPFYQYLLLDVIAFLILAIALFILTLKYIIRKMLSIINLFVNNYSAIIDKRKMKKIKSK